MAVATQQKTIKNIRDKAGMTTQDVAYKAKLSYSTVWEVIDQNRFRANTQISTLRKFADALGVSVVEMLDFVEEEPPLAS